MKLSQIHIGGWYWVYIDGYGVVMARVIEPSRTGGFMLDAVTRLNGDVIVSTTRIKTFHAEAWDFVKEVKSDEVLPRNE